MLKRIAVAGLLLAGVASSAGGSAGSWRQADGHEYAGGAEAQPALTGIRPWAGT